MACRWGDEREVRRGLQGQLGHGCVTASNASFPGHMQRDWSRGCSLLILIQCSGGEGRVSLTLARCSAFFCSVALSFLICLFSCCRMRSFSRSAGHRVARGARREHRGVRSLIISWYEVSGDVRLAWCQGLLGLGCWLGRCGCRLCRCTASAEARQHMLLCRQVSRVRVGMGSA